MILLSVLMLTVPVTAQKTAVRMINTDEKLIALTFDDGPHPQYTEEILDILEEYGIRATFFVVGENVRKYPELVKRENALGCEIGNHTFTHPLNLSKVSTEKTLDEIIETEKAVEEVIGDRPVLFRPPGGNYGETVAKVLDRFDYDVILWTVDPEDWKCPEIRKIVDNVKKNVQPGSIILMHDSVYPKSNTPEALRILIPYLIGEGYEFVTVSELLERSEPIN